MAEVQLLQVISYQAPGFSSFAITGEANTVVALGYKIHAAIGTFT
ncbi:hypothetical protein [Rufibacter latericius]|nr:hypothetical protein [Rufibacter latericius]